MIPYVNEGKQQEAGEGTANYDAKEVEWYHKVLLNRPLKVVALAILLVILAPLLIYHYSFFTSMDHPASDGFSTGSCLLPRTARLPCGLGTVNYTECHPQCCYDYELHLCFHRFPSRFSYILNEEWTENMTLVPRIATVPFKLQESVQIQLAVDEVTATHVILTLYDPKLMTVEGRRIAEKNYTWYLSSPELNVIINDTKGNNMFNTVRGPIIASENIWEIAFKMTDDAMYGFGELPLSEGTVKVLYNYDGSPNAIPLIFSRTNDTYHGLLIDIVEPTEVRVEGDNQVVIRSITKRGLKLHLFAGPEPEDIMKEVRNIIGFKNELEYWMLGVHICSETSTHEQTYDDLANFTTAAANHKIPYDSHCGVAPFLFHDRCADDEHKTNLLKGMLLLKAQGKRFVPHVSPYIFYEEPNIAEDNNSTEMVEPRTHHTNCTNLIPQFEKFLLRTADSNDTYKGLVKNKTVLYPDYETISDEFLNKLWDGVEIDGVVLENSWPIDESKKLHNETSDILPYFNEHFQRAFNHTPQWNVTRPKYDTYLYSHNEYGNYFTEAFRLTSKKRIPVFTTTQWMAGEIVNRQNIDTSWTNLQKELIEAALGGISGHWLWTSPICGDTELYNNTTQTQLCVKWYMAATFMPLIKIHSKEVPRHPFSFSGTNKANIMKGLNHRYSLLPYFYTTLQHGPLLRPMFYQFPFSKNITNLRTQFSVGNDLLIVPNLQPIQTHVHVHMPPGLWYEFWSGLAIEAEEGELVTMTTTDSDFLVLMRAGAIVIMQKDVKETADETRLGSDYSLTIALNCEIIQTFEENEQNFTVCRANGELYMNDEMKIVFEANSEQLNIKAEGNSFESFCNTQEATWAKTLKDVNVFGLNAKHNNYDHLRNLVQYLDLCQLETQEEIVVSLV